MADRDAGDVRGGEISGRGANMAGNADDLMRGGSKYAKDTRGTRVGHIPYYSVGRIRGKDSG